MPSRCAVSSAPGQRNPEVHCFLPADGTGTADPRVQRIPAVVLHHQVRAAGHRGTDLHHVDDVRMPGQTAHGALFAEEPFEIVRGEVRGQDLDRDGPVERDLVAAIHDSETAAADFVRVHESGKGEFRCDVGSDVALCGQRILPGHGGPRISFAVPMLVSSRLHRG